MSSPVTVKLLEEFTLTAPLGVRLWDVATNSPAESGLTLVAWPDHFPELRTRATEGPSGVYSFSGLPGLRGAENGVGDDAFWAANPPVMQYTVQLFDPALRYLPYQFSALLPVRGLFTTWDSPLSMALTPGPDWLPVFSSPARMLAGPAGLISATLQDDVTGQGAAWALLRVQASGLAAMTALADERGVVSLFQPYPEPTGSGSSSPLRAPNLNSQSWPVTVSVYYNRVDAQAGGPDLTSLLQQGAASVWRDTAHTSLAQDFPLNYGTDLVLRSFDSNRGRELPVLLVTSATSPL